MIFFSSFWIASGFTGFSIELWSWVSLDDLSSSSCYCIACLCSLISWVWIFTCSSKSDLILLFSCSRFLFKYYERSCCDISTSIFILALSLSSALSWAMNSEICFSILLLSVDSITFYYDCFRLSESCSNLESLSFIVDSKFSRLCCKSLYNLSVSSLKLLSLEFLRNFFWNLPVIFGMLFYVKTNKIINV